MVLRDPSATTLVAAAVQIASHRIRVLLALALFGRLHPLDRVSLGLNANAACVLEDDHDSDRPKCQERGHDPHGPLLQPRPIRRIVLCEVAIVHGMEASRREQCPMLPLVTMVPDGLVQRILLWSTIWLKLWWRRGRQVQVRRSPS